MSYNIIPITVKVSSRLAVDASTSKLTPLASSARPKLIAGEKAILAISFIDDAGEAYSLGAGDTFELGGDSDYVHWLTSGNLSGAITAAAHLTSIVAQSGLVTSDIPSTGHIRLTNATGETERIAYTAFNSSTRTFTVSATAIYSYLDGATLAVEDELMLYSDNTQVDISGDWSSIDRSSGKVSIRVDATADAFSNKLSAASTPGQVEIKLELRRYPSGETTPTVIYRDVGIAYASVLGNNSKPGTTSVQFLTQTSADARYAKLVNGTSQANMTVGEYYTWLVGDAAAIAGGEFCVQVDSATDSNLFHGRFIISPSTGLPVVMTSWSGSTVAFDLTAASAEWAAGGSGSAHQNIGWLWELTVTTAGKLGITVASTADGLTAYFGISNLLLK